MNKLEKELYDEAYEEVVLYFKEEGTFYEWINGHISNNDYEDMFYDLVLKIYEEKINKFRGENL